MYEVNLNRITGKEENVPEEIVILKDFLTIKTHASLCGFINRHDTAFSRRLAVEYMHAIQDDALLLKVEGSEKFMYKLSDEVLLEEREEGRQEGLQEGIIKNLTKQIQKKKLKMKTREQIISELELDESEIEILDNFDKYARLLA